MLTYILHTFKEKNLFIILLIFTIIGCTSNPGKEFSTSELAPKIDPDYSGVTIPPNIAPLNFIIKETGEAFFVKFSAEAGAEFAVGSKDGKIIIPIKKWHKMLQENIGKSFNADIYCKDDQGKWLKFKTITNKIAAERVDPYLYYRLLYPGYESWAELSINSRNLESFKTQSVIENSVAEENCVNCHSFNNGKTNDFLFHMRGSMGGTYFYKDGEFIKRNLKTKEMKNAAVYPRWHPSGKFVAFSSNKIIQRFHAADNKKVEVSDLESSLVLYDVERNEIMNIELPDKEKFMDTFPEWSPDGKYLYFCRAPQIGDEYDYREIKYNLFRVPFDISNRSFGEVQLVFDAAALNKSMTFPRISPDGRTLVLTLFDYGTFPIWHKEADLWAVDLSDLKAAPLDLNSDFADSYHSWSSNGRWLVFSSKRGDGLTARPFISYINENGKADKPFILPQKDPEFYDKFLKSFNIPEFSTIEIDLTPGKIRDLAKTEAVQAKWYKK
ncbi:MAG: PD40 domain-containing protein [Bacteroidales bacterium]|nr:PD40 domain-containing protein [Bacteroidales bacterium]